MTTVPHAGLTTDQYPLFRFDMVGHETGGTFVVPPPTAPARSAAPVSAAPTRPAGAMMARLPRVRNASPPLARRRAPRRGEQGRRSLGEATWDPLG